jgi:nucleotide sugar dehydrogenase
MNPRIQKILISGDSTIRGAMRRMEELKLGNPDAPSGIVVIVDRNKKLKGVVTDGDIRRAILKGLNMETPVSKIMTKNPLALRSNDNSSEMLVELSREIKKRNASESKYSKIIIVNEKSEVVDIVTPFELWKKSEVRTKDVAVIGLGYVGLTLALTLNEFGIKVSGIDTDIKTVAKLSKGAPHFYERGLEDLLKKHIGRNLFVKNSLSQKESDVYIICVGTPVDKYKKIIISDLKSAASSVGRVLKSHDLVVLRSTVPIGTCRNLVVPILEKESGLRAGKDFFISFAPERTIEGRALEELKTLPQVIGGYNKQSVDYATQLFQLFSSTIVPVSSLEVAESVKLLNNTFRDVAFSFSNEAAQALDGFSINAREVIRAANEGYPRDKIPYPSPGVGGLCLTKDPYIFIDSAKKVKRKLRLPLASRSINMSMADFVLSKVKIFCATNGKSSKTAKIFVIGIAFKGDPETSDIRNSPSIDILNKLKEQYENIFIYDPVAKREDLSMLGVTVLSKAAAGFKNADCVLFLNNHLSYRDLPIYTLSKSMAKPGFLFDGWGIYSKEELSSVGSLVYYSL